MAKKKDDTKDKTKKPAPVKEAKQKENAAPAKATPPPKQEVATTEISVRIGSPGGGKILAFTLPSGATIRQGLAAAKEKGSFNVDLNDNTLDVRLNGAKTSSLDAPLNDNDQVLLFTKIVGN